MCLKWMFRDIRRYTYIILFYISRSVCTNMRLMSSWIFHLKILKRTKCFHVTFKHWALNEHFTDTSTNQISKKKIYICINIYIRNGFLTLFLQNNFHLYEHWTFSFYFVILHFFRFFAFYIISRKNRNNEKEEMNGKKKRKANWSKKRNSKQTNSKHFSLFFSCPQRKRCWVSPFSVAVVDVECCFYFLVSYVSRLICKHSCGFNKIYW